MSGSEKGERTSSRWCWRHLTGIASAPGPALVPPSRLLLVLALSGRVEVVQHTLDVFEGGPLLRAVLPAASHDVVELLGAVLWPGHAVSPLQCPDHLRVCHP